MQNFRAPVGERDRSPRVDEEEPQEFDWAWIQAAETRELSAHGRQVQARMSAPPAPVRRPSLLKRLRFRLYLALGGRRR